MSWPWNAEQLAVGIGERTAGKAAMHRRIGVRMTLVASAVRGPSATARR
jgi:hypothetical protein